MCPPPYLVFSQLGLGNVVSSPSGVRSGAPAGNGFWCIWNLKEHVWWIQIWHFCDPCYTVKTVVKIFARLWGPRWLCLYESDSGWSSHSSVVYFQRVQSFSRLLLYLSSASSSSSSSRHGHRHGYRNGQNWTWVASIRTARALTAYRKTRYDIVYLKSLLISVMMSDIDKIMSLTKIAKVSVDYK